MAGRKQETEGGDQGDRSLIFFSKHVHLLIAEKSLKVGEVVKSIASCYVPYYNKKYGRIGHLLQDRFKSRRLRQKSLYSLLLFRISAAKLRNNSQTTKKKRCFLSLCLIQRDHACS